MDLLGGASSLFSSVVTLSRDCEEPRDFLDLTQENNKYRYI
jgi:hypothetical protein